jgi:hypothetical protein
MLDQLFQSQGFSLPSELYVGQDNLLVNATWTLFGMTAAAVLPQPYVDYLLHYEFEGKPHPVGSCGFRRPSYPSGRFGGPALPL